MINLNKKYNLQLDSSPHNIQLQNLIVMTVLQYIHNNICPFFLLSIECSEILGTKKKVIITNFT